MKRARPQDRGSVLVEAMVAVAVIALMLAVTYRAVGESALRSQAAEQSRTAALIARSRLAALGVEAPLEPGRTTGVDDGFVWRIDVEPTDGAPSPAGQLMRVSIVVADQQRGAERARLTTLRLAEGG
jgi:general secretion pathway protein I